MIVFRFDLAPMLLAFASARWLARGRATAGRGRGGVGRADQARARPGGRALPGEARGLARATKARGLASLALTVALGGLGWWYLAGDRLGWSFRYHGERGLEIGSLASSAYLVAHHLAGVLVFSHFDHGSMNLSGPGARDAASLSPILQGALLVLVAGRARRMAPGDEMRFAAAALLAFVLPGKVLSPQYLIWLVPFVCVLGGASGSAARRVFLAAGVLTTALYPHLLHALSHFRPAPVALLAARNLGLAWLFAILIGQAPPDRGSE